MKEVESNQLHYECNYFSDQITGDLDVVADVKSYISPHLKQYFKKYGIDPMDILKHHNK